MRRSMAHQESERKGEVELFSGRFKPELLLPASTTIRIC